MSRQVQLLQDREDEANLADWLRDRAQLLTLPYSASPSVQPTAPAILQGDRVVIFYADDLERIIKGATYSMEKSCAIYGGADNDGIIIEWSQTKMVRHKPSGDFAPMPGRIYYRKEPVETAKGKACRSLYDALSKWIMTTYPWTWGNPSPSGFIGSSLGGKVAAGEVRLLYPNGNRLPVVRNPKFKPGRE